MIPSIKGARVTVDIDWDTGSLTVKAGDQDILAASETTGLVLNERGRADFAVTGNNAQRKSVEHEEVRDGQAH